MRISFISQITKKLSIELYDFRFLDIYFINLHWYLKNNHYPDQRVADYCSCRKCEYPCQSNIFHQWPFHVPPATYQPNNKFSQKWNKLLKLFLYNFQNLAIPITAPTPQCVLLTGIPNTVHTWTTKTATKLVVNPELGSTVVILVPIVSMQRLPRTNGKF